MRQKRDMEDERGSLILIWESFPCLYRCAVKLSESTPDCKASLQQDPDKTAVSVLGESSSISAWTANLNTVLMGLDAVGSSLLSVGRDAE